MTAKWTNAFQAQVKVVTDYLRKARKDDAGRPAFDSLLFEDCVVALQEGTIFAPHLHEALSHQAIRDGIFACASAGDITPSELIQHIAKCADNLRQARRQQYVLLTNISVAFSRRLRRRRIAGCELEFVQSAPAQYKRDERQWEIKSVITAVHPKDYTWVLVHTRGSSSIEAGDRALDALDTLRGMWNFFLNYGERHHSIPHTIANRIVLGPLHTLHAAVAGQTDEPWWYEPGYTGPARVVDLERQLFELRKNEVWMRKGLTTNALGPALSDAVRRYVRALDERSVENGFVQLWGLLECLTGSGHNHELVVRRAAFGSRNADLTRIAVDALRQRRNDLVHRAKLRGDRITLLYQLKRHVEWILGIAVANARRFRNLEEFGAALDLPKSRTEINRRIRHLRWAKRFTS